MINPLIYVIDDDTDQLMLLKLLLNRNDFENVKSFDSAVKACDYLSSEVPALIISDVMMPVMDGLELLSKIRQSIEYKDIPVILVSAHLDLKPDSDAFLTKPYNIETLLNHIKRILKLNS